MITNAVAPTAHVPCHMDHCVCSMLLYHSMCSHTKAGISNSLKPSNLAPSFRYNNLVERCFKECAEDMRSKSLTSNEEKVSWRPKVILVGRTPP